MKQNLKKFKIRSSFKPTECQSQAAEKIIKNIKSGKKNQVLLGVTGSGKTMTMASIIEKTQKPALVISPNKTLCAQLYQEFKGFFPEAGVHYFVSYYDYYQPEAYIPQTDTYIEKDANINEEIDKLRHAAVQDVLKRKDVIVIASVSCIYNLGSPENYQKVSLQIKRGQRIERKELMKHLVNLQYQRNDVDFKPGTFRARGEIVDIFLITGNEIVRVEFLGRKIGKISKAKSSANPAFNSQIPDLKIFPAHFWTAPEKKLDIAVENIKSEFQQRVKELKKEKKLLQIQRLTQRTNHDLEMLKETGFCHGIENYSRHLEFRDPGSPPFTLLDYFESGNKNSSKKESSYITFIDESHMSIPQLNAMYNTDRSRKNVLIEHGFRLKSALDNRPLSFDEFEKKIGQTIFISATPGFYEMSKIKNNRDSLLAEQLIRPTGLLEPSIEIRPIRNQVSDLVKEIKKRAENKERTLAITLTKRMAEDLSEYLSEKNIKNHYLHSEIKTLERPQILNDLRRGKYDAVVGINLLREGLDLPEVSLIAILDADKEGFLRNKTTLIQTMGRASRNIKGHVILYADKITKSIKEAMEEVERRRKIQIKFNKTHSMTPKPITKEIKNWPFASKEKTVGLEFWIIKDKKLLEKEMKKAAKTLDFERAAKIRDLIKSLD